MPDQIPFTVNFPDGKSVTFTGPSSMSDSDVYVRALQERSITSGKIPATFAAGAAPEAAQALTGAAMSGAGYVTGNPALVAAGPLAARGARAIAEKAMGQDVTPTDVGEVAKLAAEGAVPAYGPTMVARIAGPMAAAVGGLRVHTLPQALAKGAVPAVKDIAAGAEAISPSTVGGTVADVAGAASNALKRRMLGVTSDDLSLLRESIAKGMNPVTAAKVVSANNPTQISALLKALKAGIH